MKTMKRKITTLATAIYMILFVILAMVPTNAFARDPLDEIQNYQIQVDMRPDGTMDIRYHIEWKVLDDTSEGPLEWVKIGCPNFHVDEIKALTHNIKNIRYTSDGGAYIRIDFDRKYKKDEIVEFDYSIHQSYMYVVEEDNHICSYSYTPGWFDEINVKNIQIKWANNNVIESNASREDDGYLIWEGSLKPGERLNASVKYNLDTFTTDKDMQYTDKTRDPESNKVILFIAIIAIVLLILIFLCAYLFNDDDYHGGFGSGSSSHVYVHHTSTRSSCACVSHCACACACAGGSRAGCSAKDFYSVKIKQEDLEEVLLDNKNETQNI